MEPPRSRADTNVHPLQAGKCALPGEQLIHSPPKREREPYLSLAGTQYIYFLQMWKIGAERQRTLTPLIILLSDGANSK